jgi:ATP-dependent RNA helicase MSS116
VQVARIVQTAQLQKSLQVRAFSSTIRWQQEALAEATETVQSSDGPITKFQELADRQLIHRNVIDAITGSGIETMTEVQSATINQALRGTDM